MNKNSYNDAIYSTDDLTSIDIPDPCSLSQGMALVAQHDALQLLCGVVQPTHDPSEDFASVFAKVEAGKFMRDEYIEMYFVLLTVCFDVVYVYLTTYVCLSYHSRPLSLCWFICVGPALRHRGESRPKDAGACQGPGECAATEGENHAVHQAAAGLYPEGS